MAKRPNISAKIQHGLTVHIRFFIFQFTSKKKKKISKFTFCLLAKFPANYANFVQFAPESHE